MSDQEQDRSESATPYKLQQAQKKGQVAKSQEATFTAILAVFVLGLYAAGEGMTRHELAFFRALLQQSASLDWSADGMAAWLANLLQHILHTLAPLLLAIVGAVLVSNLAQVGAVFSAAPLTPDFNRINPASGLKRLLSLRMLFEAAKSVVKLTVVGYVAWLAIRQLLPQLFSLLNTDAHRIGAAVMANLPGLLAKLVLVLLVLMLADLVYTKRKFAKDMRMSRREVTEEHKQRDGDPRIRARIRQLRQDMLKQSRAVQALPKADVLLTNPTHVAVALSYVHGEMPAPQLLAKGAGELAAKMRATARRLNIPVVENPTLARALYKRLVSEQYVPEDLYPQVAKILIWVYAMRDAKRAAEGAA